jgi:hypothetical protein
VTDPNGGLIAGAEVKASGTPLASERSVTANAEGFYVSRHYLREPTP